MAKKSHNLYRNIINLMFSAVNYSSRVKPNAEYSTIDVMKFHKS